MNKIFFRFFVTGLVLVLFLAGCGGYNEITLHKDVPATAGWEPDYPETIVVYDSWSGNTGRIAKVIAEELAAPAVKVDKVDEYNMDDFDLIVVGSPVHGGAPTGEIEDFLTALSRPPLSAVFVTFGAPGFGPATANACLDKMEKKLQKTSLGRFKCRGFHHIMRTYPDHPNEEDMAKAAQFAVELRELCLNAKKSKAPAENKAD